MSLATSTLAALPRTSRLPPAPRSSIPLLDRPWFPPVLLALLCGFLFFYGLNAGELYRTEGLRAILAAEFLRSGDWIVPRLYGEPLFTKPPGMYAAIAAASWPFGEVTTATARIPSAVAASLTVFHFYWYFGRILGRRGGLVAAIILPLSILWLDKAPSAEIDMLQVAWVASAILFFLRALEAAEQGRKSQGWWLAAMACVTGGVMTKWTAPAFFYFTIVPLLWWRGQLRLLWCRGHLVGAALGAGFCLGWIGLAVWHTGWDAFYRTVSREALMRLSPLHHDAPYPWRQTLAHPIILMASMFPWSMCLWWAVRPSFGRLADERRRRLWQALHCWFWPNLVFWSSIPEHATRHSFPLCTSVAGFAALAWHAWMSGEVAWPLGRIRPGVVLVSLVALWFVVKLTFVHIIVPMRNGTHEERDRAVQLIQLLPEALRSKFFVTSGAREPREKAAQIAAAVPDSATLYLFRLKDEGIMFYYERPVRRLHTWDELPLTTEPLFCIWEREEWEKYRDLRAAEPLAWLKDEQGADIVLVRINADSP
jgi:4-amino-4-deoxy-L-arabinose transferase-like glycosyltransferase